MLLSNLSLPRRFSIAGVLSAFRVPLNEGTDTRYNRETAMIMRRVMAPTANGVDVGAFEGEVISAMTAIAPRGTHLAIEPQPALAKRLRAKYPKVRVVECALGDRSGTVDFVEALDTPAYSGLKRQHYPTDRERTRTIAVSMNRLDDLVTPETRISFIKIDAEGAEYVVLVGALETIRRDRPIITFEYGVAGRDFHGTTPEMMWELVHDNLGFEIRLMRTWLDGGLPLTADGFRATVDSGNDWMFVAGPTRP